MPTLPDKIYDLRIITLETVERLLDSGQFQSEKRAVLFIASCSDLHGFSGTPEQIYTQYRTFKSRINNLDNSEPENHRNKP